MADEISKASIRRGVLLILWVSLAFGAFALFAAFQHNPQLEFYDPETGTVRMKHSLTLFLSWLISVALFSFLCLGFVLGMFIVAQRFWHRVAALLKSGGAENS